MSKMAWKLPYLMMEEYVTLFSKLLAFRIWENDVVAFFDWYYGRQGRYSVEVRLKPEEYLDIRKMLDRLLDKQGNCHRSTFFEDMLALDLNEFKQCETSRSVFMSSLIDEFMKEKI